ncbi:MAG: carbamoyltransferase C-terminal domain-containing protein [Polyangiaceae bacterium]
MIVLGINAYHGDASAAILVDGELKGAVEEERFERVKHWAGFPKRSVEYCLEAAGARLEDVDHIAIGRNTRAHLLDKIMYVMKKRPSVDFIKDRAANMLKVRKPKNELALALGVDPSRLRAKQHNVEHHRSHQASAYFASGYDESAVISVDGFGDFVGAMWAIGQGNKMNPIKRVGFPHSLGLFYSGMTQYLGFPRFGDEYKVMGMSAYGQPDEKLMAKMRQVVRLTDDGGFELGLEYFQHHSKGIAMTWVGEPKYDRIFSDKMIELFGPVRQKGEPVDDRILAIAACVQKRYEEAYFHMLSTASRLTGSRNVCVAGGCGQNSLANGKVLLRGQFDDIFVQPASYDAGTALGAALYTHYHELDNPRKWKMEHSYWGPGYSDQQIEQMLKEEKAEYKVLPDEEMFKVVARSIADGGIIGWFQGRLEWGARALGHRSILANPLRPDMKDILNLRIKKRESFRPFAPAILAEAVGDYFEQTKPDPFMVKVYKIKPEKRAAIPAVTHVDGTGRLQTVTREEEPKYYGVIKAFGEITGVPILINTSFNENEPIVCTPKQAYDCFKRTRMDMLVLGNCVLTKPPSEMA